MDVSWGSLDMDNNGKVAILDEISKSMMGIEVPDNDCLMSQLVIYLIMPRIACQGYKRIILLLVRDINFLKRCFCCKGSGKFPTPPSVFSSVEHERDGPTSLRIR